MLSSTYELTDIKAELDDYRSYDYKYEDKSFTDTGDTTLNDDSITGISNTAELRSGMSVSGSGIPASTTIESIDGVTSITISNNATATASDVTLTFSQSGRSLFETDLTNSVATVVREKMYPVVGESYYATLAALDKSGMSTTQLYIYWAEVYYSIAEFCLFLVKKDKFARKAATESRTQGDVTYTTAGTLGKQLMADDYTRKAEWNLAEAGYDTKTKMVRRSSVHEY